MLRLLPSPKSISGFLGYLVVALAPVGWLLVLWGNADLIAANISRIEWVLNQWWGFPLLMASGFLLLLIAGYRQQHGRQAPATARTGLPSEGTATPSTTAEKKIERLEKKLRAVEQENKRLRALLADPTAKQRLEDERLERRCGELALEVRNFVQGNPGISYADASEIVERFRRRHYGKVEGLRDELDRRGWITEQERERLTLSARDDPNKIKRMADALGRIGVGY